jgi:hypothetical protein
MDGRIDPKKDTASTGRINQDIARGSESGGDMASVRTEILAFSQVAW